jgi:crossover junction endodeoxyribonuclease RuvC
VNILALDLGTDTGFAYGDSVPVVGTWKLATAKEIRSWGLARITRRADPRIYRLFLKLKQVVFTPDVVIFEDVQFQTYTYQTQLWASFRAAIWCAFPNTLIDCVPVQTLKRFATGSGGANKEKMAEALYRLSPNWKFANLTDDAVDAIWLWRWAKQHIKI